MTKNTASNEFTLGHMGEPLTEKHTAYTSSAKTEAWKSRAATNIL